MHLANPDLAPRSELINPDLAWLADLGNADFERLFNGSPIRRAGFLGLRRNIAVAMGNSGLARFTPWLKRWAELGATAELESPDGGEPAQHALRSAARWALRQLSQNGKRGGSRA
jgi:epoxyqueuosine reductase